MWSEETHEGPKQARNTNFRKLEKVQNSISHKDVGTTLTAHLSNFRKREDLNQNYRLDNLPFPAFCIWREWHVFGNQQGWPTGRRGRLTNTRKQDGRNQRQQRRQVHNLIRTKLQHSKIPGFCFSFGSSPEQTTALSEGTILCGSTRKQQPVLLINLLHQVWWSGDRGWKPIRMQPVQYCFATNLPYFRQKLHSNAHSQSLLAKNQAH